MESIGFLEEKKRDKHNEKDTKSAESSQIDTMNVVGKKVTLIVNIH
jgi:hypothetical protein